MRKSEGGYTYFVPDVAYHLGKWQRGFTQAINIQGSDHHGTVARVRAGLQALDMGIPKGYPDYVLHKMVRVMRNGEEVKISKRAGSYVTLRDLIEWSGGGDETRGRDAVRFFLISRKGDTEFTFDVDSRCRARTRTPSITSSMPMPGSARSWRRRRSVVANRPARMDAGRTSTG